MVVQSSSPQLAVEAREVAFAYGQRMKIDAILVYTAKVPTEGPGTVAVYLLDIPTQSRYIVKQKALPFGNETLPTLTDLTRAAFKARLNNPGQKREIVIQR